MHPRKIPSTAFVLSTVCVAVFVRATISLNSYSGEATPPMYGDFEAQRHWQEVTVNLPIKDWYEPTEDNNLQYWGLDYPPLTAYHSYAVGRIAQSLNTSFVELHKSRGLTSEKHKLFMRLTVIIADLLVYIPAVLLICFALTKHLQIPARIAHLSHTHILLFLLFPGQILIDNGHFQYNNISLGLFLIAVALILYDQELLGACAFVLALNYKQMELYHALPFFCYLLAHCFPRLFSKSEGQTKPFIAAAMHLLSLGLVVVCTFLALWSPWLGSVDGILQVVHRIFPVARGLFEDKVSNVWCIINVVFKFRDYYKNEDMAKICLVATLVAVSISCYDLLRHPHKNKFILALINSSLGFFLFSFQVHEKTILLVALPVLIQFPNDPFACLWFLQIATFSMVPLLIKDGLILAYAGLTIVWILLPTIISEFETDGAVSAVGDFLNMEYYLNLIKKERRILGVDDKVWKHIFVSVYYFSLLSSSGMVVLSFLVPPPAHLPDLYPLLVSAFSCVHFVGFLIYFNYKQIIAK